ncbi:MAG: hypothetical protein EOO27_29795, partial [Comamonadaceae bacterium]
MLTNEWYSLLTPSESASKVVSSSQTLDLPGQFNMQAAIRTHELNPAKLTSLFRKQFELCRVGPGQTVAIVSDLGTRREYIEAAFAAASDIGFDIYEMCVNTIPGWTNVGTPTIGQCKGTLDALMAVDMVLIFHVPLFAKWLRDV